MKWCTVGVLFLASFLFAEKFESSVKVTVNKYFFKDFLGKRIFYPKQSSYTLSPERRNQEIQEVIRFNLASGRLEQRFQELLTMLSRNVQVNLVRGFSTPIVGEFLRIKFEGNESYFIRNQAYYRDITLPTSEASYTLEIKESGTDRVFTLALSEIEDLYLMHEQSVQSFIWYTEGWFQLTREHRLRTILDVVSPHLLTKGASKFSTHYQAFTGCILVDSGKYFDCAGHCASYWLDLTEIGLDCSQIHAYYDLINKVVDIHQASRGNILKHLQNVKVLGLAYSFQETDTYGLVGYTYTNTLKVLPRKVFLFVEDGTGKRFYVPIHQIKNVSISVCGGHLAEQAIGQLQTRK